MLSQKKVSKKINYALLEVGTLLPVSPPCDSGIRHPDEPLTNR